jgi:hypothetical protein
MTELPAGPPTAGVPSAYRPPPDAPLPWQPPGTTGAGTTQAWPPAPPGYLPPVALVPPRRATAGWGIAASAFVVLVVLAHFFSISRLSHQLALVENLRNGIPVSLADATESDRQVGGSAMLLIIAWLVAGLFVMTWALKARTNAEAYTLSPFRRSRGWAFWSWICPVVNLWFPYQVIKDIWTASDTARGDGVPVRAWATTALLPVWWTCVLCAAVLQRVSARLYADAGSTTAPSIEQLHASLIFDYMSAALNIAAAIMLIVITATITRFQSQRHQWFAAGFWPR